MKTRGFKLTIKAPLIRLGVPGKMVRGGKHRSGKAYSRRTGKNIKGE